MTSQQSFSSTEPKTSEASITLKTETAGKIGLFGAIGVIIGAIIGIGIFFKNNSVFKSNNGNPYGVLLSWIIVLVITLATAYSYGEITRAKTKVANAGLAGWSERYVGYRFSRFVKLDYPLFYYSIYLLAMSVFLSEAIFNIYSRTIDHSSIDNINYGWIVLLSVVIIAAFMIVNVLSETLTTKMSSVVSLVKFAPIILVIVCGFVCAGSSYGSQFNLFVYPGNIYNTSGQYDGSFTFTGMLDSLPAILFAFDSFLIVGNISGSVKKPEKNVPLSVILSMVISGGLYLLITVAELCCGCGNPYDLASVLLNGNSTGIKVFSIIMSALLFIAIFGVVNSICLAAIRSAQASINENVIAFSGWFKKITNGRKSKLLGGAILMGIIQIFFFIIASIPSLILQNDQIVDGLSNLVVVFFFLIYGFVPLMMVWKNKVPTSEVSHQKFRRTFAIVSFVGCAFIGGYSMIWTYFLNPIIHSGASCSWGLFYDNKVALSAAAAAGIFWGTAVLFFVFPFLNDLIIKLTNKTYNQPLLWEKVRVNK